MDKLEKPISIKERCDRLELCYANVISYKRDHPELTYEQIFEYYLHKDKEPLTKKCERLGLNYEQVRGFKKIHKELSIEQVIELFINGKHRCYVKQKSLQHNEEKRNNKVTEKAYRAKNNIEINGKIFKNLHDMLICYDINDKYETIRKYLYKHPEKTYEQVLNMYGVVIKHTRKIRTKEQLEKIHILNNYCKEHNIDRKIAYNLRQKYPDITSNELIEMLKVYDNKDDKLKVRTLNNYCKEHNIDRKIAYSIRKQHPDADIDELLNMIKELDIVHRKRGKVTFKYKCEKLDIEYNKAKAYKRLHPELTD